MPIKPRPQGGRRPRPGQNGRSSSTPARGHHQLVTLGCASGELPGTNEVQTITLDTTGETFKKGVAFTLKYGEEVTAPINMIDETSLPVILNPGLVNIPTNDWMNNATNFLVGFQLPAPATSSPPERLPSIGGGGVKGDRQAKPPAATTSSSSAERPEGRRQPDDRPLLWCSRRRRWPASSTPPGACSAAVAA